MARPLTVAVASNALKPVSEIARLFEQESGLKIRIVHGSTGKLYTQIAQGAPFDIFLAADRERPELLASNGFARGEPFTYARGSLALWTARTDLNLTGRAKAALSGDEVLRVAIANPDTAPYGRAAVEALKALGILTDINKKLVYGENVAQAFAFAATGNADVAIIALSVLGGKEKKRGGELYIIDRALYGPVVQDGLIIKDSLDEASSFVSFLQGETARTVFESYGYLLE